MKAPNHDITRVMLWLEIFTLSSVLLFGCAAGGMYRRTNNSVLSTDEYADYNIDELNLYGEWVSLQPYGHVWKPNVESGWEPFYYGHWAYDAEPHWTWVSYEPFGWIVYHYGNWLYTPEYGWVWIPDNKKWSPARVQWMYYNDFVCWAPLPPRGIVWPNPWERYEQRIEVWNVVHTKDFMSDNVGEHRIEYARIEREERRERIFEHFPNATMIEQHSGQQVHAVKIEREPVKIGKQQLHKMRIPEPEQKRVEKFRSQVEGHVTKRSGERR